MFYLVTGKQRSGKTAYLTHKIANILKNTDRYVLTDITINIENMNKHVGFDTSKRLTVLSKIERLRFLDYKHHTNTDIFIDESYQLFPSFTIEGLLSKTEQHQYMCYIMEHNKFFDNIYFIVHDVDMLAKWVKFGAQSYIRVRHSHTINMFNMNLFKGLTFPSAFFRVEEYWNRKDFESSVKSPDAVEILKPYKKLFTLYDSHKQSSGLKIISSTADDKKDFKKSYTPVLAKYFKSKIGLN